LFLNLKQSLQYHFDDDFSFVLHLGLQQAKILQNQYHHHSLTKLLVPILLKISGLLITTLRVLQHLNHQFLVILIPNLIFFLLQTSHFLSLVCLEKFVINDFKKQFAHLRIEDLHDFEILLYANCPLNQVNDQPLHFHSTSFVKNVP
jgi:hypothetical protein